MLKKRQLVWRRRGSFAVIGQPFKTSTWLVENNVAADSAERINSKEPASASSGPPDPKTRKTAIEKKDRAKNLQAKFFTELNSD